MSELKKIYFASVEDVGEVEGMFDEKGELIDTWCCNDGTWRGEYFDHFIKYLGAEIFYYYNTPKALREKMENALREHWGEDDYIDEDEEE
jgi:hypothetical protein